MSPAASGCEQEVLELDLLQDAAVQVDHVHEGGALERSLALTTGVDHEGLVTWHDAVEADLRLAAIEFVRVRGVPSADRASGA